MKLEFNLWGLNFGFSIEEGSCCVLGIAVVLVMLCYSVCTYSIASIPYDMKKLEVCNHAQR